VVIFVLLGNTKVLGESGKPYICKWSIMNSVIIFYELIHLLLLNLRERALHDRILVGAIYSA
jgi:hypothetical protein